MRKGQQMGEDENLGAAPAAVEVPAAQAENWYGPDVATLGDRIAASREAAGLTPKKLARRLGIKTATLMDWEADVSEPRANRLSMMAGLLNVSIMWLLNGEGEGVTPAAEEQPISAEVNDLLLEVREVKTALAQSSDKLARLEKKLRQALKDGG